MLTSTQKYMDNTQMELDSHIIARYCIEKRIGKGAYGIVWRATDRKTRNEIALKKIFDAFQNKTDAQRTYREIFYLQRFKNHPNIVTLLNIHRAVNCNDIYLVFEYMEVDLHKVIRKGNILKDIHNRYIIYQILKAISYIHSSNVIHRDLKPANILLDSRCHCKVADFGLARSVLEQISPDEERYDPSLTDYIATRWYRAPEILIASKMYQKGVDMWSIGCILAELIMGKPLFPGSSTIHQIELITTTIPPRTKSDIGAIAKGYGKSLLEKLALSKQYPLNKKLHNVDHEAYDLISKLLVFNPLQRITSVQALKHSFVNLFSKETDIIPKTHSSPNLKDDTQLSVDEYRKKLYDIIASNEHSAKTAKNHQTPKQRVIASTRASFKKYSFVENCKSKIPVSTNVQFKRQSIKN